MPLNSTLKKIVKKGDSETARTLWWLLRGDKKGDGQYRDRENWDYYGII